MSFVANFIRFPAVHIFENRLRFDKVTTEILKVGIFETQCILDVLNNFICTRLTVKSRDESFRLDSEQTSSPYSTMGIHFGISAVKLPLLMRADQVYQIFRLLHDKSFVWHCRVAVKFNGPDDKMPTYRISFTREISDPFLEIILAQNLAFRGLCAYNIISSY